MFKKDKLGLRLGMVLLGVFLIGFCIGLFRLSELGIDACAGMNLGISGFLGISFGTWQMTANAIILIVVFFTLRNYIGLGTLINMVGAGYTADFVCWLIVDAAGVTMGLPLRIIAMVLALILMPLGIALCIKADLGTGPYDCVAPVIEKLSKGKCPYARARIISDIVALCIGCGFCLAGGNNVWQIINIATVCNAVITGPLVRIFGTWIEKRLL